MKKSGRPKSRLDSSIDSLKEAILFSAKNYERVMESFIKMHEISDFSEQELSFAIFQYIIDGINEAISAPCWNH